MIVPRRRLRAATAVVMCVASFLLVVGLVLYGYRNTRLLGAEIDWVEVWWLFWPLPFVVVGTLVAVAQPRILVGWALLIVGFATYLTVFGTSYAGFSRISGSSLPLSSAAAWFAMISSGVAFTMAPIVVTRLPSGRPDTRMTRLISRISWVLGSALTAWWGFGNERLKINTLSPDSVPTPYLENPLALVQPSRAVTSAITTTLAEGLGACFLIAVGLVLARRRRASVVERAQLRWLGLGLLALPVGVAVSTGVSLMAPLPEGATQVLQLVPIVFGLGAIPVSIGVSVLRFRLFEIDRILSRTLTFSVVALVLGGVYAALSVLPALVIGGSDTSPSWLVATSTLVTAALFSPLRHWVRRVVDRRFNRSRYDAEHVIERFTAHVGEFNDVATITEGLGGAVREALHPATVAVWVRPRNDPVTTEWSHMSRGGEQ